VAPVSRGRRVGRLAIGSRGDAGWRGRQQRARPFLSHARQGVQMATAVGCAGAEAR
jgi:hypothetical protein